jgi:hypothetical protein
MEQRTQKLTLLCIISLFSTRIPRPHFDRMTISAKNSVGKTGNLHGENEVRSHLAPYTNINTK